MVASGDFRRYNENRYYFFTQKNILLIKLNFFRKYFYLLYYCSYYVKIKYSVLFLIATLNLYFG